MIPAYVELAGGIKNELNDLGRITEGAERAFSYLTA